MQLELKHILPYLPHGLKVQYEGIINTKEISEYRQREKEWFGKRMDKGDIWACFPESYPEHIIGLKIGYIKEVGFYLNHNIYMVGTKTKGLKKFYKPTFKPILQPKNHICNLKDEIIIRWGGGLSDKAKEKWVNEVIDDMLYSAYNSLRYDFIEFMHENHIDIFGLINEGLAISIHDV